MKRTAEVFVMIGLVLHCILAFLFFLCSVIANPIYLIIIVFDALGIAIGVYAIKQLKKAKCKQDITVIAVVTLIFCSLIGGILMLCCQDSDFTDIQEQKNTTNTATSELESLFTLKEKGILTEEEFNEKKEKLLKNL